MLPIVIYDFNVLAYAIYARFKPNFENKKFTTHRFKKYKDETLAHWAYLLNRGPVHLDYFEHQGILVDDIHGKNGKTRYWRNDFYEDYKGSRGTRSELLQAIRKIGIRYATKPSSTLTYLAKEQWEGDDIAATIVKIQRLSCYTADTSLSERYIYLYTVDCDWMQLISDTVIWVNTAPYPPVIRTLVNYREWPGFQKLNVVPETPYDIVKIKQTKGDPSDKLPAGCDIRLIDLLNPMPGYSIREAHPRLFNRIVKCLNSPVNSSNLKDYQVACKFLQQHGIAPCL